MRARFLLLVPLLAACAAETEEDRVRRLAVEAAQRRNMAAGAAILLILLAAYRLWRPPRLRPGAPATAAGALLCNEVVSALLLGTVGMFAGLLLGPEPAPPSTTFADRDTASLLWLVFVGPYAAIVGLLGAWLRGAPERLATGRRYARLWLGIAHGVAAAVFLASSFPHGEDYGYAWFPRAGALAALAAAALLAADGLRARRR